MSGDDAGEREPTTRENSVAETLRRILRPTTPGRQHRRGFASLTRVQNSEHHWQNFQSPTTFSFLRGPPTLFSLHSSLEVLHLAEWPRTAPRNNLTHHVEMHTRSTRRSRTVADGQPSPRLPVPGPDQTLGKSPRRSCSALSGRSRTCATYEERVNNGWRAEAVYSTRTRSHSEQQALFQGHHDLRRQCAQRRGATSPLAGTRTGQTQTRTRRFPRHTRRGRRFAQERGASHGGQLSWHAPSCSANLQLPTSRQWPQRCVTASQLPHETPLQSRSQRFLRSPWSTTLSCPQGVAMVLMHTPAQGTETSWPVVRVARQVPSSPGSPVPRSRHRRKRSSRRSQRRPCWPVSKDMTRYLHPSHLGIGAANGCCPRHETMRQRRMTVPSDLGSGEGVQLAASCGNASRARISQVL